MYHILSVIVFKERIYKIWKQFTTNTFFFYICLLLCSKNEYTKSESNSQLLSWFFMPALIVFKERIYKIWKQFTTHSLIFNYLIILCSKNEYTKSESNSQLILICLFFYVNCVQRTNIQNLKAIHNYVINSSFFFFYCVQRTNIQNLKAIHNCFILFFFYSELCSKNEYTKSESNSQPHLFLFDICKYCVQRTNIQNLKAIHN